MLIDIHSESSKSVSPKSKRSDVFMSNVSESPYDLLMLSYQGNIVLLESEEMHTADLRRAVLAVTVIKHESQRKLFLKQYTVLLEKIY